MKWRSELWFFHCTEIWHNFDELGTLSFVRYFAFWSDLLKEFNHSEVIWWTLNSCLISLTLFVKQVIYHFSSASFFSPVVTLQFVPMRCSILSINSINSAHYSDAFTSMFLKLNWSRHWNFHRRNISSFSEHLLRELTLMTEPKCNGISRTNRYIFWYPISLSPNLKGF